MILPSKHISEEHALIGVGAILLQKVNHSQTVTSLWESVRDNHTVGNFERFILALDMLYIAGAIVLKDGLITRTRR